MTAEPRVVIAGGGQAAAQMVGSLRSQGFGGAITMFCAEDVLPYQRPPLSKKYLLGALEQDKLLLRKLLVLLVKLLKPPLRGKVAAGEVPRLVGLPRAELGLLLAVGRA